MLKKFKKTLAVVATAAMFMTSVPFNSAIQNSAEVNSLSASAVGPTQTFKRQGYSLKYKASDDRTSVEITGYEIHDVNNFNRTIEIPDYINGRRVDKISANAFADTRTWGEDRIERIVISEGVRFIENSAFEGLKFRSLTLPDSIESIGEKAFYNNSRLENVSLSYNANLAYIFKEAFSGCTSLRNFTFSNKLFLIDAGAFANCQNLGDIIFPNTLTLLGAEVFNGCNQIHRVIFPNGSNLNAIPGKLFMNCHNLSTVSLPDSLISIGYSAFENTSINSITIPESVTSIATRAFCGCRDLKTVNLPSTLSVINSETFKDCSTLERFVIPDGVTSIEPNAFQNCISIKDITIPESIASIGVAAFQEAALVDIRFNNANCEFPFEYKNGQTISSKYENGEYEFYGTIHGYENSTAQEYAEKCDYNFVTIIDDDVLDKVPDIILVTTTTTTTTETTTTTTTTETTTTTTETTTTPFETFTAPDETTTTTEEITTTTETTTTTTTSTTTTTTTTTTTSVPEETAKPFSLGENNWSFLNKDIEARDKLDPKIYNALMNGLSNVEKAALNYKIAEIEDETKSNPGSCYGMSVLSLLSFYDGIIDYASFNPDAKSLYDLKPTDTNADGISVKSLIRYYHLLQFTDTIDQRVQYAIGSSNSTRNLNTLIHDLNNGLPTLLTFSWKTLDNKNKPVKKGHAVVAYGIEKVSYSTYVEDYMEHMIFDTRILLYDTNYDYSHLEDPRNDGKIYLYVNTQDPKNYIWYMPAIEGGLSSRGSKYRFGGQIEFVSNDVIMLNNHGYFHFDSSDIEDILTKTDTIRKFIPIYSTLTLSQRDNIELVAKSGQHSYNSENDIIEAYTLGDENSDFNQYIVNNNRDNLRVTMDESSPVKSSMRYENDLISVQADSASNVLFYPESGVEISGTAKTNYELDITTNDGFTVNDWYNINVSGINNNISLVKARRDVKDKASGEYVTKGGYILKSNRYAVGNIKITAKSDNFTPSLDYSSNYYREIFIYEIDENTIGIAVDTDDNTDNYEFTVASTKHDSSYVIPTVNANTPDDTTAPEEEATAAPAEDENAEAYLPGDADCDGVVTISDAVLVMNYVALGNDSIITPQGIVNADVYCVGDGINNGDALSIQKFLANLIETLPESYANF